MFSVYIIQNAAGKIYIGHTNDLTRRLREHNTGLTRYTTNMQAPWKVIHHEDTFATRSEAMARERFLKTGKGREYIKSILKQNSGVAQR